MKRGQIGIGLVILGVIAIIAVIGLVLLFTRASKPSGAMLTDLSIGNVYGGGNVEPVGGSYDRLTVQPGKGISTTYQTPKYLPNGPAMAYPAYKQYPTAVRTKGTRTPAFIVSGKYTSGGFASLEDRGGCEWSLIVGAHIGVPHDQFNCYTVPNKGASAQGEVKGFYPPATADKSRPTLGYYGKTGGDVYCYANSIGAEQQKPNAEDLVRENILQGVVAANANQDRFAWTTAQINGKTVPVCWVSAKEFPFDQGLRS